MGNSLGNFTEYWDIIRANDLLQGGCIWDWVDQGLAQTDKDGNKYWAFGGDFGPKGTPSAGDFCCNGMILPDRSIKPQTVEMAKVYQNIWFKNFDHKTESVDIFNENFFVDLSQYELSYEIKSNGKVLKTEKINTQIQPQETKTVKLSGIAKLFKANQQTTIQFYAKQKNATLGLPANWIVAKDQFIVNDYPAMKSPTSTKATLKLTDSDKKLTVSGKDFSMEFDKKSGIIISYKQKGVEYFSDGFGPRPFFWRAPLDNDYGAGLGKRLNDWKDASYNTPDVKLKSNITPDGKQVEVSYTYNYEKAKATWNVKYIITDNGRVKVENAFNSTKSVSLLFRVGMRMQLPASFVNAEYYGRGPISRPQNSYVCNNTKRLLPIWVRNMFCTRGGHHVDTLVGIDLGWDCFLHRMIFEFNATNYLLEY